MPAAVSSPCGLFAPWRQPIVLTASKGAYAWGMVDEQPLLDTNRQFWVAAICGHAASRGDRRPASGPRQGTSFGAPLRPWRPVGELVIEAVPQLEMCARQLRHRRLHVGAALMRAFTGLRELIKFERLSRPRPTCSLVRGRLRPCHARLPIPRRAPQHQPPTPSPPPYNDLEPLKSSLAENPLVSARHRGVIPGALGADAGSIVGPNTASGRLRELTRTTGAPATSMR